ncbi:hypothetical protein MIND_00200900 [Mycena indigotica]|uniref:Uncharacterized protein n=1 Tax=Mycena indigotica TaxID=2126181 RepID=A0A8H6WBK1_9AGAR|nr:uncharacterized protein MIND_00200900 [Mycena indigotica]KAF7311897.1 hypothetical protein MIND_00200900 [Mycena indigotica]
MAQMTRFLTRWESLRRFGAYLQWALPGYSAPVDDFEPEDENDDDAIIIPPTNNKDADTDDNDLDDNNTPSSSAFKIAKNAPFSISVQILKQEFGTADFLTHLHAFLSTKSILPNDFNSITAHFPVYKRVTITIPPVVQVSTLSIADIVRATRALPAQGLKKAVDSHFNTVLAWKTTPEKANRLSITGLFAGRVRAIFALPMEYGWFETPLAYIEWFKPLTQRDETLGMFKISPASHQNRRRASIIPITLIN